MLLNYYKDWCKNCTRDIITTCDSFGGWVRCNLMICYADQWILRLMIAACCLYWELLLDIVLTHSLLACTSFLKGKDTTIFFIILEVNIWCISAGYLPIPSLLTSYLIFISVLLLLLTGGLHLISDR